jgi:hypothetical protein
VSGQTLKSSADPAVSITFDPAFHYAGGQVIDIMDVAGAEQHFFVDAGPDKQIRRFYWVQFEHMYPSVPQIYHYDKLAPLLAKLGGLSFVSDTASFANYFFMDSRAGSDSEATRAFLRSKGYKLDGSFVRTRMFHLDDSKRKELMIIYGELLPGQVTDQGKTENLSHAQQFLKVVSPQP